MTPLLTKWREQEEEFERIIGQPPDKAFYRQSLIAIIEGEVLRLKDEKRKLPKRKCVNLEMKLCGRCFDCERTKGFNAAINQQISYYQSTLEGLKKL